MNWSRAGESSATTFGEVREQLLNYFINPAIWTQLLVGGLKIIVIVIAGRLTIKIANKALHHILMAKEKGPLKFDTRRANTFGKLIGNIISYVVNFIMILMILNLFGFRLEPLLAGAGVIGLAVGFGAQSLVKDVITGFFIIFEDQFSVGDVIQINTYKGTVEEIGLRITKIKSWTGEVYIIPNGTISQVTNFSLYNSLAVVDVSVSYEEDIDKAMEVLKTSVHNFFEKSENIVLEPEVLGVQKLGASEVILRVIAECKPNTHAPVARELNGEIKRAFKDAGIAIPYPKLITYHRGEGAEETWKKSSTN
ncbi:mechanosensitive ion channel family protein [Paenibacillus thalictri]|uniref:Mechanosensitive ion channel family protein n=1 Tax=Paenibacillus thalictri TaxID=2527873 RepID=A0A4Q9DNL2_9BACL|nr:mechanosensitive ion channel family protein [Paenibacillus thalictri]TBL77505.1 mechanosensitive ion channel family protein [Paenibacillus thalictri]